MFMYEDINIYFGTPCFEVMDVLVQISILMWKKETENGCWLLHASASGGDDAIIPNTKYLKKTLDCHVQNISTFFSCVHKLQHPITFFCRACA